MPLQQCDLLLHESGAPPIHTPLNVLQALPEEVKRRLYVVHTSALPEGCGLRIGERQFAHFFDTFLFLMHSFQSLMRLATLVSAPTGTEGTIRLDNWEEGATGETSTPTPMTAAGGTASSMR